MSGADPTIMSAALAFAVSVALLSPGRPGPRRLSEPVERRWARLLPFAYDETGPVVGTRERVVRRGATAVVAGALLLLFGLPWGLLLGAVGFVLTPRLLARLEPAANRRRTERIIADLPLAVDLLAACLRAGRPPADAVATVARAVGGSLGDLLDEVERRLRLGADPDDAWDCLVGEPACAGLARAVRRAVRSGAPLASTLEHLADDVRQDRRWQAEERARAVETRSVVPLGLCFLPAFVLLGIVPTVAGSLSGVLSVVGG